MSDVFLCVVRGVINVNRFEVRLLLSSHLLLITFHQVSWPQNALQACGSATFHI